MPRALDVALEVDRAVAERGGRLARRGMYGLDQVGGFVDAPHATAAATGGGLDQEREADSFGLVAQLLLGRRHRSAAIGSKMPGTTGTPASAARRRAASLSPSCGERQRQRTDERDAGRHARLGQGRLLGQEAVAGMDRLGTRLPGRVDDPVDAQVAIGRRRGPDADGDVGQSTVKRVGIRVGEDGDRLDPQLAAGADDAHRDLAAVGDQEPPKRRVERTVFAQRHRLERDVAVLARQVRLTLAVEHLQRRDDPSARVSDGGDHVIDVAAACSDVRVRETLLVLARQP